MTNTPHSNSEEPIKKPISLDTFLSFEESKLLDLISKSALSDDKKFELEYIAIPSVREVVEKILKGYLGDESDLRLLGDPKVLPSVMTDIEQEDGWNSLGSLKRRMIVRGVKWKEEMEEGFKEMVREKMRAKYTLEEWMNLTSTEKGAARIMIGVKEKGLKVLAGDSFFKTGGDPADNDDHMQNLLEKIYTPEEFETYLLGVKEKMKELYSLEEWMNLTQPEKQRVKIIIGGKVKGLKALANASFFNTGGNPVSYDDDMKNLLREIYSPEEFEGYLQGVREKMRAKYTLEEWMNLTVPEKKAVKILIGRKEKSLGEIAGDSFFKIGGEPVNNNDVMQKLLREIYSPEEFEGYLLGVREEMRAKYSLEEWINLIGTEKKSVKIIVGGKEKSLKVLAGVSFFKTGGNPVGNSSDFKNLMIAVYGEEEIKKYSYLLKAKPKK